MDYSLFVVLVAVVLYWLTGLLLWLLFLFQVDPRWSLVVGGLVRPLVVFFAALPLAEWLASVGVF